MNSRLRARLLALGTRRAERRRDPRLGWDTPTDTYGRATVLAVHDYCQDWAPDFWRFEGPQNSPGFDALAQPARALIVALWGLWGSSRRFPAIVASFVDAESEYVRPLWSIESTVERAQMRRRFPGLLKLFATRGDPLYTSHATYRAENWPERATWTQAERHYIGKRFHEWDFAMHPTRASWYRFPKNPFTQQVAA